MEIGRYLRAFIRALRMTLMPQSRHPKVGQWASKTVRLVDAVYRAADASGITRERRESIMLRVYSRPMRVETLLAGIRYHAAEEYPYLLRHETEHSLTGIHASSLNDRFYALKLTLAEELLAEPLHGALVTLRAHLDSFPENPFDWF